MGVVAHLKTHAQPGDEAGDERGRHKNQHRIEMQTAEPLPHPHPADAGGKRQRAHRPVRTGQAGKTGAGQRDHQQHQPRRINARLLLRRLQRLMHANAVQPPFLGGEHDALHAADHRHIDAAVHIAPRGGNAIAVKNRRQDNRIGGKRAFHPCRAEGIAEPRRNPDHQIALRPVLQQQQRRLHAEAGNFVLRFLIQMCRGNGRRLPVHKILKKKRMAAILPLPARAGSIGGAVRCRLG